ncbi:hypothetical protein [uncultured Deinococcus sp.]|uniref:hypothetical protein n=1 Tax=uncultured Deinococcus sp. TaxID=158789 RepID=UPI0025FA30D9|nr:hypothetical protein [uncultured Deinococcus sp.]
MTSLTPSDFPMRRDTYLQALQTKVHGDARVRAAWVEGSLGRGTADRYSDIDLHLSLEDADVADFTANAQSWLSAIHPLVLYTSMFDGHMLNALTDHGIRVDVWPHAGHTVTLDPNRIVILHQQHGAVTSDDQPERLDAAAQGQRVLTLLREFWRCVTLLPAVIGRSESLVAFSGLAVELGLVTELLVADAGAQRDRGVKHLNAYLREQDRAFLETVLRVPELSAPTLVTAHLGLVQVVRERGPTVTERLGVTYPRDLETAALRYVGAELIQLGIDIERLLDAHV